MRSVCYAFAMACLALTALGAAERVSVDDVINMAKQNVGEEVLLAAVERSQSAYDLNTDQILKLKEAGVPEKVIAAMLRKKGTAMPPPIEPAAPPALPGAAQGTLNVENVDELPWAYRFDSASKILWISKPDANSQKLLAGHGGVSLSAPAGSYEVRYVGEDQSNAFTVVSGQTSLLLISRVDTQEFEGLYVSVFEQGERKGGGKLAVLRQTPRTPQARAIGQPQATYQYIPAKVTPAQQQTQVQPQPQTQTETRIVERVVEPQTTVIYRPAPVYYSDPWYYHRRPYYRSYYHPWNRVHFRYGSGCRSHHRSGWSIGFGFGF